MTNVYAMGATAFALFAGYQRERDCWPLGAAACEVVCWAVCEERSGRQTTIRQLAEEWEQAVVL